VTPDDAVLLVRAIREGRLINLQEPFPGGPITGETPPLPFIDSSKVSAIRKADLKLLELLKREVYDFELETN
jgi:hypothetical protein